MIDEIEKILLSKVPLYKDFYYPLEKKGNFFILRRNSGGYCPVCEKSHDNSSAFLYIQEEGKVILDCYKNKNKKKRIILGVVNLTTLRQDPELPLLKVDERYTEKEVRKIPFDISGLYGIKSPMGTGKTKKISAYLKEHLEKNPSLRCLSLTSRRALAFSSAGEFKRNGLPFQIYEEIEGKLHDIPLLILQMESLHRVGECNRIREAFLEKEPITPLASYNILILDEIVSLINQLFSPTMDRVRDRNVSTFARLIKETPSVIAADAMFSEAAREFLHSIRDDVIISENAIPSRQRIAKRYTHEETWLEELFKAIEEGKKIFITSYSKKFLTRKLEGELIKRKVKYAFYHKDSDDLTKKKELPDVNQYWKNYQVVGISPSVGSGVDFNQDHFDSTFSIIGRSCTVGESFQMIHRVRNLKENTVHLYLDKPGDNSSPLSSKEEILEELSRKAEENKEKYSHLLNIPIPLLRFYVYRVMEEERTKKRLGEEVDKFLLLCNYATTFVEKEAKKIELEELTFSPLESVKDIETPKELYKVRGEVKKGNADLKTKLELRKYKLGKRIDLKKEGAEVIWEDYPTDKLKEILDNAYREKTLDERAFAYRDYKKIYAELLGDSSKRYQVVSAFNKVLGLANSFLGKEGTLPREKLLALLLPVLKEKEEAIKTLYKPR